MEKQTLNEILLTLGLCLCSLVLGIVIGMSRGVPFVERHTVQSIGIYTGTSPLQLSPASGISMPVISPKNLIGIRTNSISDPFLAKSDTGWCLFFTINNKSSGSNFIGLAESKDGFHWQYRMPVVEESFSLSYPCVFKSNNRWFLIPDCSKSGQIRLYMATYFPYKWRFERSIMCGIYSNPTVFLRDSTCWMFVENPSGSLRLFFADSAMGEWFEHPQSPVVRGNNRFFPSGGGVAATDTRLLRFARDFYSSQGSQIRAFEITTLSRTAYQEREVQESPIIGASGKGWNASGMDQLDAHRLNDSTWIAAVTGAWDRVDFGWEY